MFIRCCSSQLKNNLKDDPVISRIASWTEGSNMKCQLDRKWDLGIDIADTVTSLSQPSLLTLFVKTNSEM